MRFDIITIFPSFFNSFLNESLIKKAQDKKIIDIHIHDLRKYATDRHKQVDDRPFGGGAGMVIKIEPVYKALEDIKYKNIPRKKVILFTPTGRQFNQKMAARYAKLKRIIFLCGRYEGIDARVERFVDEKVSIGPYILSGGEIPAMAVIEAVSRLLPGFLGNRESIESSIKSKDKISEYPVYTRPSVFVTKDGRRLKVPSVLLSGNHKQIEEWRQKHIRQVLLDL